MNPSDLSALLKIAPIAVGLFGIGSAVTCWIENGVSQIFFLLPVASGGILFGIRYWSEGYSKKKIYFISFVIIGCLALWLPIGFFSQNCISLGTVQFLTVSLFTFFALLLLGKKQLEIRFLLQKTGRKPEQRHSLTQNAFLLKNRAQLILIAPFVMVFCCIGIIVTFFLDTPFSWQFSTIAGLYGAALFVGGHYWAELTGKKPHFLVLTLYTLAVASSISGIPKCLFSQEYIGLASTQFSLILVCSFFLLVYFYEKQRFSGI